MEEDEYGSTAARHYDSVYALLRSPSGDMEFYRRLARESGGPVLELGCGTGRVLLPIAGDGIACTGLDPSEAMLEALRRKRPPRNLRLVSGRMQDFDLAPDRFTLIFSAFRAFQHLLNVEDQLACLNAVRRHLVPGGLFAFDVFAPKLERIALREEPEFEEARWKEGETEIVRFTTVRRDPATQVSEITFRYERRRPGSPPESDVVRTRMRHFFRYEIEHLLARSGFTDIRIFGGFDRRPFDYFSGETVVLAQESANADS
jgi:SAM-dependent methyltransferase